VGGFVMAGVTAAARTFAVTVSVDIVKPQRNANLGAPGAKRDQICHQDWHHWPFVLQGD